MNNKHEMSNAVRSNLVRGKIKVVRDELSIPYFAICEKAKFKKNVISQFVNGKRDFNDHSLDRLEPVIDRYLRMIEYSDNVGGGR